jgi:two-component system sensor histidine kinase KdpD
MTRVESGSLRVQREWIPLEEVVGTALSRLDRVLTGRPVHVALADGLPLLAVDPLLFEQVLVNLVENAAKYTPAQSPIDIGARQDGDSTVIEVSDRGPGIPPGDEQRVFEKFYRGGHTAVAGAGLGLAICKGIVEAHGGTVAVSNRVEGGATFRIVLPKTADEPSIEPPSEQPQTGEGAP